MRLLSLASVVNARLRRLPISSVMATVASALCARSAVREVRVSKVKRKVSMLICQYNHRPCFLHLQMTSNLNVAYGITRLHVEGRHALRCVLRSYRVYALYTSCYVALRLCSLCRK